MKKRNLLTLASVLMVGGIAIIAGGLGGNHFLNADTFGVVATNTSTITSFLVFGGAMIGTSIIFFIILSQL